MCQNCIDLAPVFGAGPLEPTQMDVATTEHQAAHGDGESPVDLAALWQIGDAVMARANVIEKKSHLGQ